MKRSWIAAALAAALCLGAPPALAAAEDMSLAVAGVAGDTPYLTCGPLTATVEDYLKAVGDVGSALAFVCHSRDIPFQAWPEDPFSLPNVIPAGAEPVYTWEITIDGVPLDRYLSQRARVLAFYRAWTESDLAPVSTPETFSVWSRESGYLRFVYLATETGADARTVYKALLRDESQLDALAAQYSLSNDAPQEFCAQAGELVPSVIPILQAAEMNLWLPPFHAADAATPHWAVAKRLPLTPENHREVLLKEAWPTAIDEAAISLAHEAPELPEAATLYENWHQWALSRGEPLVLSPSLIPQEAEILPPGAAAPSQSGGEAISFADVAPSDWFASSVQVCVDAGLMQGTGEGHFTPDGALTVAEVAAIAARLRESATGEAIPGLTPLPGETLPWYQQYVSYLTSNGVSVPDPSQNATRQDFISLLAAVTPAKDLSAINAITALPDTDSAEVLRFYNAGILTGTDDYGTFAGDRSLTRAEAAAMIARVVKPELRLPFTPKTASAQPPADPDGDLNAQVALTVNGAPVTAQQLAAFGVQIAYQLDSYYYGNFGVRLTWDKETEELILDQAKQQSAAYVIMTAKAAQLGCQSLNQLSAAMTPAPTQQELADYVSSADLLCAKHILVKDESSAQSVISALNSQPTLTQFDNILSLLGTDPGMASNPNGYLFTAGEMVEEFEAATRALDVGAFSSQPVQSQFGFHVILRLDPLTHPELTARYQDSVMNAYVDAALAAAQIQVDQSVLDQIDLAGTYDLYLQTLAAQQGQ